MSWSEFIVKVKNRIRGALKTSKSQEIRRDRIKDYSFSCTVRDPEHLPDKDIRKLIALNPWTAVASPPSIHYAKDKNSLTQIDISFGVIHMKEGEVIEKEVRAIIQKA
jgi:hypothetical protein